MDEMSIVSGSTFRAESTSAGIGSGCHGWWCRYGRRRCIRSGIGRCSVLLLGLGDAANSSVLILVLLQLVFELLVLLRELGVLGLEGRELLGDACEAVIHGILWQR